MVSLGNRHPVRRAREVDPVEIADLILGFVFIEIRDDDM
jgi:hypothetical protein